MEKKKRPKNNMKDLIARSIQKKVAKTSPRENLQENLAIATNMSSSIGSVIENLSINTEADFSDEQKKIFKDMLETLKKISLSQKDTTKEQKDVRANLAKLVVQSEKQVEKIKKDLEGKDKELENKAEEIRYLEHWKETAEKDERVSEDEKKAIQKDLDGRKKELDELNKEKKKLQENQEKQISFGKEMKGQMVEPQEKREGLKDAIKADLTSGLRRIAPGLSWKPKEGESYRDMLKGNVKGMMSGKGFMQAFGSVLEQDEDEPSNEELLRSERIAAGIPDVVKGKEKFKAPETTSAKSTSAILGDLSEAGKIEPVNGEIDAKILSALEKIVENTKTTADLAEEADRESDSNETTITPDEKKKREESVAGKIEMKDEEVVGDVSAVEASAGSSIAEMGMDMLTGGNRKSRRRARRQARNRSKVRSGKGAGKKAKALVGAGSKGVKGIGSKLLGKAGSKTATKAAGKGLLKSGLKKIPALGLVAGLGFGAGRLMTGDWKGALGEVASGAAGSIPGIGTAASMAIDAGLTARDMGMMGGVENMEGNTGQLLGQATEAAMTPQTTNAPSTTVNNITTMASGGSSPVQPTTPVRTSDNSFIRFQDKRVARV